MQALHLVEMAAVEEKRQAYQDAFQEQMEHYKTHGKVECKKMARQLLKQTIIVISFVVPIGRSRAYSNDSTSLEEVSLDEVDAAGLDEFLKELVKFFA